MLLIKHNVDVFGLKPEANLAITVVNSVYDSFGKDCIVTSVTDGTHTHDSDHYTGYGVDFRTFHIPGLESAVVKKIRKCLTDEYVVLLEKDHIHVSFNPTLASKRNNA